MRSSVISRSQFDLVECARRDSVLLGNPFDKRVRPLEVQRDVTHLPNETLVASDLYRVVAEHELRFSQHDLSGLIAYG
jgi:hypothetical protein